LRGLEKRSSWQAATGGMLIAVDFWIYMSAQVVIAFILVFMVIASIFFKNWLKSTIRQWRYFGEDL
jgi:hypothetical protein